MKLTKKLKTLPDFQKFFPLIQVVIIFAFSCYLFRSLLFDLSNSLLDWNDYPYYVWTISQNVQHFATLSFDGIFNTNSFYPHQGSLLFSDVLFPQSIIAFIWQLILVPYDQEPILIFNITFFTTLLLNIIASNFLSARLFNKQSTKFLATAILSFSPFFFLQYGHFQMISFWPGLFALGFLFSDQQSNKINLRNSLIIGLWLSIQLYASVYLGVFFLVVVLLCKLFRVSASLIRKKLDKSLIHSTALVLLTFAILAGPLVYKYKLVQSSYEIGINYSEYIYYSANITDYLFIMPYTVLGDLLAPWNKFNFHTGGEPIRNPSILLTVLAILGIFSFSINKSFISITIKKNTRHIFFLAVLLLGFIFSLGPRLSVNGTYLHIPLPYHLFVKTVPIFEPIRATNRWYFVFFIGLWYFSMKYIDKKIISKKLLFIIFVIYCLEIIPFSIKANAQSYYPDSYLSIQNECKVDSEVLLELPITPFKEKIGLIEYLQYRTSTLLASTKHQCDIVNGYSGLTPSEYQDYDQQLFAALSNKNQELFIDLLSLKDVRIIKLNKDYLENNLNEIYENWFVDPKYFEKIYSDNNTIVVLVKPSNE